MTKHTFSATTAIPFIKECGLVSRNDLQEFFDIPPLVATSALQRLVKKNVIHSVRRRGGGALSVYAYGPPPKQATQRTDMLQFLSSL
jgi:DNA-binding IscR family transcriptional regulator